MTQQALELGEPVGIAVIRRDGRRFNCVLILWMTMLTIGLVADLSLHFTLKPLPTHAALRQPPAKDEPRPKSPKPKVPFFDLLPAASSATGPGPILWRNMEDMNQSAEGQGIKFLKIKQDGLYFLYGQVTLTSGVSSSTVEVIKWHENKNKTIMVSSINERSSSTGFFGKILHLEATSRVFINCTNASLIKTENNLSTFVGIYRLD